MILSGVIIYSAKLNVVFFPTQGMELREELKFGTLKKELLIIQEITVTKEYLTAVELAMVHSGLPYLNENTLMVLDTSYQTLYMKRFTNENLHRLKYQVFKFPEKIHVGKGKKIILCLSTSTGNQDSHLAIPWTTTGKLGKLSIKRIVNEDVIGTLKGARPVFPIKGSLCLRTYESNFGYVNWFKIFLFFLASLMTLLIVFAEKFQSFVIYITENPKKRISFIGLIAAILFGVKLWLIGTYGNATPYWDQWDAEAANLYKPFLEGTLGLADLFAPWNEHRIFTTRLLALALLNINGIWNPLLQMVINAVIHIVVLVFGITLLSRVIGRKHLPALLGFSLVLFGIPYAWENTLAGFQSQFYLVLLFSIASLWFTVTQQPLSARWWAGVICAMFAFLSLASGIFALAAAAIIGLVFYAVGLRKTLTQLIAIAILAGLFTLGTLLTPSLAHHASLKAASFPQFIDSLMAVLGWPISSNFFSALIRNLPAFVFVGVMLWKRPPANDRKWFLLALVIWTLGQAVSIAYGRAVINLSPRYLDLFAIGILVNFACLISIAQDYIGKRHVWTIIGVSVWTITVLISLGLYAGKDMPAYIATKRDTGIAQEINVRNYLATGDFIHLKDKPWLHVPFPNSERLASILASSSIRTILPTNIRSPLTHTSIESEPAGAFVVDGFYPTTTKRITMTLGSYGAQGDVATGQASIRFDANKQSALLAIPVAGYPLSSGMKLEVEQNGQRNPVIMKSNPKESWMMAYARVGNGPFSIHITDSSTTAWLAVGAPSVTGRLDALINGLLANYLVFIMLGLVAGVLLVTQYGLTSRVTKPGTLKKKMRNRSEHFS